MNTAANYTLKILETPQEIAQVEALEAQVWPGVRVVPGHVLLTAAHNGGLVIGCYDEQTLVGFAFGFVGIPSGPGKPAFKHCSHMLGVHPDYRDAGIGFKLKRAQWQMVRQQGLDLVTWTFDPLESRNAYFNIAKLGAVCSTYKREEYGEMQDALNAGLPSDRFQVDWWVNSARAEKRLSSQPRPKLDLAHFLAGGAYTLNPTSLRADGLALPSGEVLALPDSPEDQPPLLLVEIPTDFQAMRSTDRQLALNWRLHTRKIFEQLFSLEYFVTDFVFLPGKHPRSYYVLSRGSSTLGG
ncbi:MAG: GNAT family N-acetyltransferase [Anaerolineae bacterium]|nr:GNAT family N-acetyltransferase [Anaerolineae bacterium]